MENQASHKGKIRIYIADKVEDNPLLKYFRESYIAPALESGMIERLYPDHPKHPKQQYRLTVAAEEWVTLHTK